MQGSKEGKVLTASNQGRNIATGLYGFRFGRQRRQGGPRGATLVTFIGGYRGLLVRSIPTTSIRYVLW